jgi:hypothetical protein
LPTHVFSQKAKDAFTTKTHAPFEKAAFSGRLLRATLSEDDLPPAFRFRRKMGLPVCRSVLALEVWALEALL